MGFKKTLASIVLAGAMALGAGSAKADIIESYNLNDDSADACVGGAPRGQTFTLGTTGTNLDYIVSNVKLKVSRLGNPGAVNVSIRDASGTGSDLSTGSFNGNLVTTDDNGEWVDINMTPYTLLHSTQYALIVDDPAGNGSPGNFIDVRLDLSSPTYSGGEKIYSYDSGSSWTPEYDKDLMFEVRGTPVPEPATLGLLAVGGLGLLANRKKK